MAPDLQCKMKEMSQIVEEAEEADEATVDKRMFVLV